MTGKTPKAKVGQPKAGWHHLWASTSVRQRLDPIKIKAPETKVGQPTAELLLGR